MSHIWYCKGEEVKEIPVDIPTVIPGVASGIMFLDETAGIMIRKNRFDPGGSVPAHKAAGTVAYQILEGSGIVFAEDDNGNVISETPVVAGELMICEEPHCNRKLVAGKNGLVCTISGFNSNK